jgi:hypothetical protein
LYDDRGNWSTEYKELTSDFYLDKHWISYRLYNY